MIKRVLNPGGENAEESNSLVRMPAGIVADSVAVRPSTEKTGGCTGSIWGEVGGETITWCAQQPGV